MRQTVTAHAKPPSGRRLLLLLVAAGLVSAGCGPPDPRVKVEGTVTLDGRPLAEGQVIFVPDDRARGAEGGVIAAGRFTIRVHPGSHRVEIVSMVREERPVPAGGLPEQGISFRNLVPSRYNEQSTLTADAAPSGPNRVDFELTSDKPAAK
jgi:hypothetical protein